MTTTQHPVIASPRGPDLRASARTSAAAWAWLARILVGSTVVIGACTIVDDEARELEAFREGGCGAGRTPGTASQTCTYVAEPDFDPSLADARCNGDDTIECTYTQECTAKVTQSNTCRSGAPSCPIPVLSTPVTTKVFTLANGSTLCNPPNQASIDSFCHGRRYDVWQQLRAECSAQTVAPLTREVSCCVDKVPCPAPKPGAPATPACELADDGGLDDGGFDDGGFASSDDDGGGCTDDCAPPPTCEPGQALSCVWDDAASDFACTCAAAQVG